MAHLNEIDDSAIARMELLIKQMAASQGVTEDLKAIAYGGRQRPRVRS